MILSAVSKIKLYFPGLCLSMTIGLAALFLSNQYGMPAMLMALLLGLAFHFLSDDERCKKGLFFSAKTLLRTAVALLGLRITITQVFAFGWQALLIVVLAVIATLIFGVFLAKIMGYNYKFGALSGGAVAICGASAAMAISSVMPQNEQTKKETLFSIIGVTTLSTIAMIFYPILVAKLGFNNQQAGLFLGATIHDVAQVTGAGYSLSPEIGDISTFFKLLRVAMLVPIVLIISFFVNRSNISENGKKPKVSVPLFLIGFVLLFLLNSLAPLPSELISGAKSLSSMLLLTAVAALGVQTSLNEITKLGIKPILLIVSETLFIAIFVLAFILFI